VALLEPGDIAKRGSQLKTVAYSQDPLTGLIVAAAVGPLMGAGASAAAREVAGRLRTALMTAFARRECAADCDRVPTAKETGPEGVVVPFESAAVRAAVRRLRARAGVAPWPDAGDTGDDGAGAEGAAGVGGDVEAGAYRYVCPQRLGIAGCEHAAHAALVGVVTALLAEAKERAEGGGAARVGGGAGRAGGGAEEGWASLSELLLSAGGASLVPMAATEKWLKLPRWHTAVPQSPAPLHLLAELRTAAAAAVDLPGPATGAGGGTPGGDADALAAGVQRLSLGGGAAPSPAMRRVMAGLGAGSPAIDAGLDPVGFVSDPGATDFYGTALPQGLGYDVGAHESR
jgi:hypothetical protein